MPQTLPSTSVALRWMLVLGLLGASVAACGDEIQMCTGAQCNGRRDGGTGDGSRNDVSPVPPSPTQLVSIEISPADRVLDLLDGARVTQQFTVTGRQRNGETRPVTALRFSLDAELIGTIDPMNGMFVASGVGGQARVSAYTMDGSGLMASTMLTVNARTRVLGPGVTEADVARFTGAMPAADAMSTGPQIAYPLAGAVMPRNVFPPKVMWSVRHMAAGSDLYRVRLQRAHGVVEGYFRGDQAGWNNSWQVPRAPFGTLSGTDVGTPIVTTVAVLSGTELRESAPLNFRTVDAVIGGAVYYWSPPAGRIFRIDVDEGRRVNFLPNPPSGTCIACHSLSRDGRTMAAVIHHGSSRPGAIATYDVTGDLTASPPPTAAIADGPGPLYASAFSGDGQRLVIATHGGGQLSIVNAVAGATAGQILSTAMLPAAALDPEWSWDMNRDASRVAFSMSNQLHSIGVTGDSFGAPQMLHAPDPMRGEGPVDWHPTWTPNSRWIVFQNGNGTTTAASSASLYMVARDGGPAVRLNNLAGGASAQNNFRPVMSPYNSGGYFWVLFTTTRNYGTAQAGVVGQKQIWVAAINNNPMLPNDPSEVAYYLEGQEPVTNLDPRWAPPPCRPNGTGCSSNGDCCSGTCGEPDGMGNRVCAPPRGMCRMRGQSCSTNSDCCAGLTCGPGMICDVPLPG